MTQPPPNPRPFGAIVVGLVVAALAIAAVVSTLRPVQSLDPDTPEGVVQAFYQAIEAKDYDAAHALLGSAKALDCTTTELAAYISDFDRVVIDEVVLTGSSALVKVEVHHVDASDPLNPYTYTELLDFEVERENGRPLIIQLPWPFYCGG